MKIEMGDVDLVVIIPFGVMISVIMVIAVVTMSHNQTDDQFQKHYDDIESKIVHMDCQQLRELRLDNISVAPFPDGINYGAHWSSVRDTYNALSCGTHWGFWED